MQYKSPLEITDKIFFEDNDFDLDRVDPTSNPVRVLIDKRIIILVHHVIAQDEYRHNSTETADNHAQYN